MKTLRNAIPKIAVVLLVVVIGIILYGLMTLKSEPADQGATKKPGDSYASTAPVSTADESRELVQNLRMERVPASSNQRFAEASRKQGAAVSASVLYATLADPSKVNEHPLVIRQIAELGRSDESTLVLLAYLKQSFPPEISRIRVFQQSTMKMDVLTYVAFTGGPEARQAMKDGFLNNGDSLWGNWLPRLNEEVVPDARGYSWQNSFRGRAAVGLMNSGFADDRQLVRDEFRRLHENLGQLSEADRRLYWILVDSLAICDLTKRHGSGFLLGLGLRNSEAEMELFEEARKKYLPDADLSAAFEESDNLIAQH